MATYKRLQPDTKKIQMFIKYDKYISKWSINIFSQCNFLRKQLHKSTLEAVIVQRTLLKY